MRTAALLGAASLVALGGCVLVYHPGDYTVGGGGAGGTTSGSTTASGTTTTGGTTSSSSSTTTTPPRPQCWNADAESDCAGVPAGERWPAGAVASGVFHAVSLGLDGYVDLAGTASGTLVLQATNMELAYDAGTGNDYMARLDDEGNAEFHGGTGSLGEMRGVTYNKGLMGLRTEAASDGGRYINVVTPETETATTSAAAFRIGTGQPTCKAAAAGVVNGNGASVALGVGVFGGDSSFGHIFCGAQDSSTASTLHGGIFVFSHDTMGKPPRCEGSRYYGNAAGGTSRVNAVTRNGTAVFVGGTYEVGPPELPFQAELPSTMPTNAKNGFVAVFDSTSLGSTRAYAFDARSDGAETTVEAVHVVEETRVYVAGEFHGSVLFDARGDPQTTSNDGLDTNAFLVRLDYDHTDKTLTFAWARFLGGAAGRKRRALALAGGTGDGSMDALYLAGTTDGELNPRLDGTGAPMWAGGGMYLLRIDAPVAPNTAPSTRWAQRFGDGTDDTDEVHLAADATRLVLAGGRTRAIDFGNGPQAGTGLQVPFVALFTP